MTDEIVTAGVEQAVSAELELARKAAAPDITISIVNHPGSGATDADLQRIAAAIERQVREHFAPAWFLTTKIVVRFMTTPSDGDWVVGCFENADQPGALGYHDATPSGLPLSKIFPKLDLADGANLSTTISHEVLEMLADPFLTRCVQDATGKIWALEVADACENNEYEIDGVKVSDFVTPHYFEPPKVLAGVKLDHLDLVKAPFEVLPGGYMQYFDAHGWHQVTHKDQAPRAYRAALRGRYKRRGERSGGAAA